MGRLAGMALPTVVREADLYHRFNRSAPLRLLMFECGDGFVVKAKCYGVGPRPDIKLPKEAVKPGFERAAFEQELIRFEQFGYEVNWSDERKRKGFTFAELRAQPIRSESASGLLSKTDGKRPDILTQRIVGGTRVMVVIDYFGQARLFDPNRVNTSTDGCELRGETRSYLSGLIDTERSFGTILEAFYSDLLGLHITDVIVLNGQILESKLFEERLSLIAKALKTSGESSLLSDCVVPPKALELYEYKQLTRPQPNNPAYLLRPSGVGCTLLSSGSQFETVIIDHSLAMSCSLCESKSHLKGVSLDDAMHDIHIKNPVSLFSYNNTRRYILNSKAMRYLPVIL